MPLLHLHGLPRLSRDGAAELVLSAREAALLAWLHLEGPAPRARLAGLLWPGGSEAQARANLRQTLVRLKRAAGAVVSEADGRLHLAVPVANGATGAMGAHAAELLATLAFDDAPEFSEWLSARRDDALRRHQREQLSIARQGLDADRLDRALAAADAVLATHPESEEAWRVRMEAFLRRGDRASALQAWDDCRHALRAAFGVAPSAATQALGQQLLSEDTGPPAANALPPGLRHPPQLFGREQTLSALQQGIILGHGAVLLGPAGIGKSRLLAELARRCGPVLASGARPGDAQQPGALLARLVHTALRRFEPLLDAATSGDLARLMPVSPGQKLSAGLKSAPEHQRLLRSVSRALQACCAGGMRGVLIDDLHFADEASLEALQVIVGHWLAPTAEAAPPAAILAGREDELPPAARVLVDLLGRSGRASRTVLGPLPPAQVREMTAALVNGAPELADALHAQLGGNPGFLLESLKSLWLDGLAQWTPGHAVPVPATLREAVRRRLLHLSPPALQLAQLAAVAQAEFSLTLAASATGGTLMALAPALAELEHAQVFDGQAFGHDLLTEAVRGSLSAALSEGLHGLVAEHLIGRRGAAGRIAHHLHAARQPRAALPWYLQCAREARLRWLMADAAAAYEQAARGLDQPGDTAQAFAAWREAARCRLWANHYPAAQAALQQAAPLARSGLEATLLHILQTAWLFHTRQLGEAVTLGTRLAAELEACADTIDVDELAYGLRALVSVVPHGVDVVPCLVLADRGLARVHEGEAAVLLRSVRGGLLQWALRLREAQADLGSAWNRLAGSGDPGQRVIIGNQLMRVRNALGDLAGAREVAQVLLHEAARLQLGEVFQCDVMHVLAMLEIARGDPQAGLARFDTLVARFERLGQPLPDAFLSALALACIAVGRHAEALAWLERHPARGQDGFVLPDIAFTLTRAKLALRLQDDPSPWLSRLPPLDPLPPALQLQCRVALATLQPTPLPVLLDLAQQLRALGMRGLLRSVEIAASQAALAAGLPRQACEHAQQALALAACVDGWIDEPATAWLAAARALQAAGDGAQAAALAATGAAWVRKRAAGWARAHERDAWCQAQPVHRELLAWVDSAARSLRSHPD